MPKVVINSANIDTLEFSIAFDIYNGTITFDASKTTYYGSGISLVQGIAFSLIDQDGVPLDTINFSTPQIPSPSTNQVYIQDISSLNYAFLFQKYQVIGAIKDQNGSIYQTEPLFFNVGEPKGINEDGYIDGVFQVIPNCINTTLIIKEHTALAYCGKTPVTVTKNGTLYYPTGTVSPITFTNTPFESNLLFTGQYRINNTTTATYDMCNGIYVIISYIIGATQCAVFDINCGNRMSDIFCCLEEVQKTAKKHCDDAIGANARQQLLEVSTYLMSGIIAEQAGMDASLQYEFIKKRLNCNCESNKIRQVEPSSTSIYQNSIVITGQGVTQSVNGSTTTYTIVQSAYTVTKGNTGDLAFTITPNAISNGINYSISFNYGAMASYILTAIAASPSLITQLNSLIRATTQINLFGLDGGCIIDLTQISYFLTYLLPNSNATVVDVIAGSNTYNAPTNLLVSNSTGISAWLNGLNIGEFSTSFSNATNGSYFNILTNNNVNSPISITLLLNGSNIVVPFQQTSASLIAFLQSVVDYLCNITPLQIALGQNLSLCSFDYNGNTLITNYLTTNKQSDFNSGVAASICNIVSRMQNVTKITCTTIVGLFQSYPNTQFNISSFALGVKNGNCAQLSVRDITQAVLLGLGSNSDLLTAFCNIANSCSPPAPCPDINGMNITLFNGQIALYSVGYTASVSANQSITIQYRLANTSTWTVVTSSLILLPNGNVSGVSPFIVFGTPAAGATYQVQVINNCGGNGFIGSISVPSNTPQITFVNNVNTNSPAYCIAPSSISIGSVAL